MKREWKPGDVARVVGGTEIGLRVPDCPHAAGPHWHTGRGGWTDGSLFPPRPLVVIDPEDREQVERLTDLYESRDLDDFSDDMQAALREFANLTPPKPDEPTGLGAVVEDSNGDKWVRIGPRIADFDWLNAKDPDRSRAWRNVAVVRVLGEGVS